MRNLQSLTTLLCKTLLDDPVEADLSHITLNLPQQSTSAIYRIGFDCCYSTLSFTLSSKHCKGALIQEQDGEYWEAPELITWNSIEEYQEQFETKEMPAPLPWCFLLKPFNSVELIRVDPETDSIDISILSGQAIARAGCWNEILIDLP